MVREVLFITAYATGLKVSPTFGRVDNKLRFLGPLNTGCQGDLEVKHLHFSKEFLWYVHLYVKYRLLIQMSYRCRSHFADQRSDVRLYSFTAVLIRSGQIKWKLVILRWILAFSTIHPKVPMIFIHSTRFSFSSQNNYYFGTLSMKKHLLNENIKFSEIGNFFPLLYKSFD